MATAIQWRRGTTSQHSSFTGLAGEITVDTDLNTVIVHDGSTAGGHRIAKYSEVTSAAAGDISSVVAGNGLSGGATTGDATINLDTTSGTFTGGVQTFLAAGTLAGHIIPATDNTYDLGSSSKMWRDVYVGPGSLYVNGQKVLEDDSGTITVTADENQNLTIKTSGSGDVELNASGTGVINLQSGITVDSGQVLTGTGGLTMGSNINLNSQYINNLGTPVASTDAATKAYVDAQVDTADALSELSGDSDDVTEGSTNLYHTTARARAAISVTDAGGDGSLAYGSGVLTYTGPSASETRAHFSAGTGITVTDGVIATTITQYADSNARDAVSVTDAGGDGSLTYNSTSGVITYTGPSASEVRAHITASTGISITDGAISTTITQYADSDAQGAITVTDAGGDGSLAYSGGTITYTGPSASETRAHFSGGSGIDISSGSITADSTVVRTTGTQTVGGAKTFSDDLILSGNLTVNGTQTIVNTETLTVDDNIIILNNNEAGTPSEDSGIEIERGTSTNAYLHWKESSDAWVFNDGSSTYTMARTTADLSENTNLYYTDARADARVAAATGANLNLGNKDTDDLSEGSSNLYYTNARADARVDAGFSAKDSDDLGEGSTNLYFTNARARSALSGGTGITYNSSTGAISLTDTGYVTGVTAGTLLDGGGTSGTVTLNVDLTELPDMTSLVVGSEDELVILDNGVQSRKLVSEITLSDFNNDAGFTTNIGDITGVTAGNGLTGGGSSGGVSIALSDSHVRGLVSGGTGVTYDNSTGVISLTDTGYVTGVTAGTGLSGGGTSGTVTVTLDMSELTDMTGAMSGTDEFIVLDGGADRRKAANEIGLSIFSNDSGFTTNVGDITAVTAGSGLTGGATSGGATLNVGAGTGITVNANDIAVDMGDFSTSDLSEGTNQYHTSARVNTLIDARVTNSFVDALNVDADTLDGISSASFLRSDANDSHSGTITPSSDNALDLGSSSLRYNEVYAVTFRGVATSAQYADLAEKYETEKELEAGTVVCFGGAKEVEACAHENDHRVAGVISTDPAYMMNSNGEGQYVALTGRVPCKVVGPVAKGDLLVSSEVEGHAKANNDAQPGRIIGKAVGSIDSGEGVIEVLVNMM